MPVPPGTRRARHILAAARGIEPSPPGSRCACCGDSLFAAGRPSSEVFGATFTDWPDMDSPGEPWVCAGCVSILSGRPGDDPPPLRTLNVLAVDGDSAAYPKAADVSAILRAPPDRPFVLAYGASMKRHSALRAGTSTPERIEVGTDAGTVVFLPAAHVPLLEAIEGLRAAFSGEEIAAGSWPIHNVARLGPLRWAELDAIVAPYRPSLLLDVLCELARRPEPAPKEGPPMNIDELDDRRAADLLSHLAEHSHHRVRDGLLFWSTFFAARVALVQHFGLREMVSRLADSLAVSPLQMGPALALLDSLDDPSPVERAIRTRRVIVLTYARELMRARIDARKATSTPATETTS